MDNNDTVQLAIRIDRQARADFTAVCRAKMINGSELLRRYIIEWSKEQKKELAKEYKN